MFHAASSPASESGTPEHVHPRTAADDRQEHREGDERDLDRQPPDDVAERDSSHVGDGHDERGVGGERPELVGGSGDHGEREHQGGDHLALRRHTMQRPGLVDHDVAVGAVHRSDVRQAAVGGAGRWIGGSAERVARVRCRR